MVGVDIEFAKSIEATHYRYIGERLVYYKYFPLANTYYFYDKLNKHYTIENYNQIASKLRPIHTEIDLNTGEIVKEQGDTFDVVKKPKHYMVVGDTEAKELIAVMLEQYVKDNPQATPYQIYCAGNIFNTVYVSVLKMTPHRNWEKSNSTE